MNSKLNNIIILNIFFIVLIIFFFSRENLYFLKESIFPWDAIVFKDLAIGFFDSSFKDSIPYRNTLLYNPHAKKLVYPLITGYFHHKFNIELIQIMMITNVISIYLTSIISFFVISKFVKNNFLVISVIILFLLIWNAPLRASLYNPAGGFAFETFLISLSTSSIFLLDNNKKINVIFICLCFFILSMQRFIVASFILFIPIIIENFSLINLKNKFFWKKIKINKIQKIMFFVLIFSFFLIYQLSDSSGSYNRAIFVIKFLFFHANPLEFIYTYYYSYGAFFLVIILLISLKSGRKNLKKKINNITKPKRNYLISMILISIILSTIGGDDSDRMLFWFFIWHLVVIALALEIIIKFKNYIFIISLIVIHLFGSRFYAQGIPKLTIADKFINNQSSMTNFNDNDFQGPEFLKKLRYKLQLYEIENLAGINYNNKSKIIETYLVQGKIKTNNQIEIYKPTYKYRINNIPFPLGYIHNQRDFLIDHPWHGKWWVRFLFLFQWAFLQLFFYYLLKKNY